MGSQFDETSEDVFREDKSTVSQEMLAKWLVDHVTDCFAGQTQQRQRLRLDEADISNVCLRVTGMMM